MSYRSFHGFDGVSPEIVLGLSGSGWLTPENFKFPTTSDYVSGVTRGMAFVRPIIESKVESFIAPIKAQASGVIACVETATSKLIPIGGDVASMVAAAKAIGDSKGALSAMAAVDGLLKGTLNFSTDLAKAVPELSSVLKIAPQVVTSATMVIGAAVQIIQLVASAYGPSQSELKKKCQEIVNNRAAQNCPERVKAELNAMGTGAGQSVSPADLFRTYAYAQVRDMTYPKGRVTYYDPIPMSLGSMFVGLCGDQVPAPYRKTARSVGKMTDKTRQQMWSVIEGIMAAIENPNQPPKASAGGMALFPVLEGLIWNEISSGRLTEGDIGAIAEQVGNRQTVGMTYSESKDVGGSTKPVYCGVGCGVYVKDVLFRAFMSNKNAFRSEYFSPRLGWEPGNPGRWNIRSVPIISSRKPSVTLSILTGSLPLKAILKGTSVYDKASAAKESSMAKLSSAALVLGGAGVAAYLIANRKKWS